MDEEIETYETDMRFFDNDGRTVDRYSALMPDGDVLVMSPSPSHPQGVCTYLGAGGIIPGDPGDDAEETFGVEIDFTDLPEPCQKQVLYELREFYAGPGKTWSEWLTRDLPKEECGSCGGLVGPSREFPWHYEDEDCRAIREPGDESRV